MAKADIIPAKTETKVIVVEPERVHLDLSVEEAQVILAAVGRINDGEGRNAGSRIFDALYTKIPNKYKMVVVGETDPDFDYTFINIEKR